MKQKIKQFIQISQESFTWGTSHFIKKDKNIWIFGAIRGSRYMDNAKYLFEYVNKNTEIKAIWISKNHEVVDELNSKGFNAFHEYSSKARYYASVAKVAVITHRGNREKADLPMHTFSKKTKIIQLWHGIPLKKIAYDDKLYSFKHNENSLKWKIKVFFKSTLFPFLNYVNEPSLILALSNETQDIFSQAFRIPKETVVITGYPRNDILLNSSLVKRGELERKKVIYMPTFRGSINSNFDLFLQYGFDIEKMDIFLAEQNMQLDIKLHPFNRPSSKLIKKLDESKNIFFLDHDAIYEVINRYDMLITDYSSIYFDYLLLDRPIIFAPFDKEIYMEKDREFYFEYDEVTPGPKAMNWDEVMKFLKKCNKDTALYAKERKELKDRFHSYQDNKSTQRTYEAILDIVNEK